MNTSTRRPNFKLQKVWRSKAQENAIERVVELDVGAARVLHCVGSSRGPHAKVDFHVHSLTNKYTCVGESIFLKVYFTPPKNNAHPPELPNGLLY